MLPDLSAQHIFVLVVVALIVVGPKDLPALLRKIGQFMAKLRGMANEFRSSFDEMARQSELEELRNEVNAMRAAAGKPMEDFKNEFEGHLMQPLVETHPDPPPMVTEPPSMEELTSGSYLPAEFQPPRGAPPVKSTDLPATDPKPPAKAAAPKAAEPKAPAVKAKPKAKPKAQPRAEPGE